MSDFEKQIKGLINEHSIENASNTPDFILAGFLIGCLGVFNTTMQKRATWYDEKPSLNETSISTLTVLEAAKKLVNTFPERMPDEPTKFDIPAYIVQELRDAIDVEQQETPHD